MFGFFKKQIIATARTRPSRQFPLATDMSDSALVDFVLKVFSESKPVVGALFLVGLENLPVYYSVFHRNMLESKEYPSSMDGMVAFVLDAHLEHLGDAIENEVNRRRWFYIYVAALLTIAHNRARAKPELWDAVAEIWVLLMEGARALPTTLDKTALWKPSEVELFNVVQNEEDGEKLVEHLLLPKEIRYHEKLKAWRERDLPQDIRDELARMDNLIRGE
jgi:hypothetical protein